MEAIDHVWDLFPHQRAVREFSDRPVDDASVTKILAAALRAPTASNAMPLRFIVIRDQGQKDALSEVYEQCFAQIYSSRAGRTLWSDVPVLIAGCIEAKQPGLMTGASIYPAFQNLMLAARALGLGTVITTLWSRENDRVREILGVPEGWHIAGITPLGYPAKRMGKSKRPPAEGFVFHDRWSA